MSPKFNQKIPKPLADALEEMGFDVREEPEPVSIEADVFEQAPQVPSEVSSQLNFIRGLKPVQHASFSLDEQKKLVFRIGLYGYNVEWNGSVFLLPENEFKFTSIGDKFFHATIIGSSDSHHPHANWEGSSICWGGADNIMHDSYKRNDWISLTLALIGWTVIYNDDDAYTSIYEFDSSQEEEEGWRLP